MNERLLVVDDEPVLREALAALLRDEGYDVIAVDTPKSAVDALEREAIDLVLTDVKMLDPESGQLSSRAGFDLLARLVQKYPGTPVVMITALQSIDTAVEAMRMGAANYIVKPYRRVEIKTAVEDALSRGASRRNTGEKLKTPLVSRAPAMQPVVEAAARAAQNDSTTVLIFGPPGTGKEFIARAIHRCSIRRDEPFVPLELRAIPENLFEAEVFGSDRGAYTGATRVRRSVFEHAARGTVFLDAIDEAPLSLQAKLILPIEKRQIRRVGGSRSIAFAARVIASASAMLAERVRENLFRSDLYYALRVLTIEVPPLRARREDLPALVAEFTEEIAQATKRNLSISPSAIDLLQSYDFPGNVRELRNIIQLAAALAPAGAIELAHVNRALAQSTLGAPPTSTIEDAVRDTERNRIQRALARHPRNLTSAAAELGISRTTLWRKIRELNIRESRESEGSPGG